MFFRIGLKEQSNRGRWNKCKRRIEDTRELGRAYDFLVESRLESVKTPAVFRVREDGDKNHRTQTRYRQAKETKCGEMNRRESECLNSTIEIGELSNPEESREGSEASEF